MQIFQEHLNRILPVELTGSVTKIVGLTISVAGFPAPLGSNCRITRENSRPVDAQVIGFQEDETLLLSYGDFNGIRRGNRVSLIQSAPSVRVGERLLGRVLDGRGRFLDELPAVARPHRVSLHAEPTSPLNRARIDTPLCTGIRSIDTLLTCGKGQRLGIFSGSGIGKSTLLGQFARSSSADVNVVILVGERGREVREFLERDLGPDGLSRSVVVVATSDEPALVRIQAAYLGTAIAEYFRDTGRDVLLMMDSVTRFARAQREIGLAAGEPPATRGYPPSVFANLPLLLERSGRTDQGSITGFYTVLVEGDDANEPISDAVRGILDGHIMLSRKLAHAAHWPAIDVLESISRSMNEIISAEHRDAAIQLKQLLAAYRQHEDMISIGAYQSGANPLVDVAIQLQEPINRFLQQKISEPAELSESIHELLKLAQLKNGAVLQAEQFVNQPVTAPDSEE